MHGNDDFDLWDVGDEVYNAIRMAELAAEGAALRASARAALLHRVALALLGVSLLLSIAMLVVPALRPWSGQAVLVLILGVAAYLLIVAIAYWSRPRTSSPELRRLRKIRHGIAALLHDLQATRGARQDPVLIGTLTDAIDHLDEQLIPALQELIERRFSLERQLGRYERGELPAPDPGVLARLREIHERQQTAIAECVRQAANAHATLVALLQAGDESVAGRARAWAADLTTLYDSLAEVLHGTDDPSREAAPPADEQPAKATVAPETVTAETPPAARASDVDGVFLRQVEDALRRARDPGRLTGCELIERLPRTMGVLCRERLNGRGGDPTSLEQAQVLGEVLRTAVERLKPDDATAGRGTGEMLRYHVLFDAYIRGLSSKQIMTRYGISESTLHRHRREGVRVVAQELIEQERRFWREEHGRRDSA